MFDNSILLVVGTVVAVTWANLDTTGYEHATHPLHFWVNDVGMVFFFALAAKEVFEATLPGGPLASLRQAASPLAAAVGGMLAPAVIYVALATRIGPAALARGWAIPCATDIAFSAMVARLIFPGGHPAIPFLLLLAIADDALGLIILAVFYPSGSLSFVALGLLMSAALLLAWWLRRRRTASFWPYVMGPGVLSWAALYWGGFHPALALVPIVPFMPHSAQDLGLFDSEEEAQPDTLSRFEHWGAQPVQWVLLLFGLANAGVPLEQVGNGTYYVLAALLLGKPLGIVVFSYGARLAGARLPNGLVLTDVVVVGIAAAVGFTVALFFATAAFPAGSSLAETKMGALLSFGAAPLALLAARLLRRRPG
ncbi:MAG: Na+/H+ antiporter NhaA [Vicinamibacteraceae bacterium]